MPLREALRLSEHANLDAYDGLAAAPSNMAPLLVAVVQRDLLVLRRLLRVGASPNQVSEERSNALHLHMQHTVPMENAEVVVEIASLLHRVILN